MVICLHIEHILKKKCCTWRWTLIREIDLTYFKKYNVRTSGPYSMKIKIHTHISTLHIYHYQRPISNEQFLLLLCSVFCSLHAITWLLTLIFQNFEIGSNKQVFFFYYWIQQTSCSLLLCDDSCSKSPFTNYCIL